MTPTHPLASVRIGVDCGHFIMFAKGRHPLLGELVICGFCGRHATVTEAPVSLSIYCGQCHYARGYGRDMERAEKGANKHVAGKPTHKVSIRDGDEEVVVVEHRDTPLPSMLSLQGLPNEHALSLRKFVDRYQTVTKSDPDDLPEAIG